MVPWIQVYSNLPQHSKIYRLTDALGLSGSYQAVGIVVSLWLWGAVNAEDGDFSGYPLWVLARAIDWPGDPERLAEALVSCGFLDRDELGGMHIHDWQEYAGMLLAVYERQRKQNQERARRYRDRRRAEKQGRPEERNVTRNVTMTQNHASREQKIREDKRTEDKRTEDYISSNDARDCNRQLEQYLQSLRAEE